MTINRFKTALGTGQVQVGLWQTLGTPVTVELCAAAGFDWLLLDAEHAPHSIPNLMAQLQAMNGSRSHPIVRLPATDATVTFTALSLQGNEKVIRGSRYGSARMREDFPRMVELYKSGKLRIDELINRRFSLDETGAAYQALAAGELARGLIVN